MAETSTVTPEEEVKPDETGKFSQDYVSKLREEAKNNRIKAKEYADALNLLKEEKEKKEREALESQNEFKTLYETAKTENDSLKTKVSEFDKVTEKLTAIEQERKDELLAQLSDTHKEFAKDLPLDKLSGYVKLHKDTVVTTDSSRAGGFQFSIDGKTWDDFGSKELEEIEKKNPDLYNKLKNQKYK